MQKHVNLVDLVKSFAQNEVDVLYQFCGAQKSEKKARKKMRQSEKEKQYSIEGVPKMRMPFEIPRFLFFFARKDLTKLLTASAGRLTQSKFDCVSVLKRGSAWIRHVLKRGSATWSSVAPLGSAQCGSVAPLGSATC